MYFVIVPKTPDQYQFAKITMGQKILPTWKNNFDPIQLFPVQFSVSKLFLGWGDKFLYGS